jgi:PPK2 family polyphosphate:nucleotide phosphotransferase
MTTINVERFRVHPDARFNLDQLNKQDAGLDADGSRSDIESETSAALDRLRELQKPFYAENERALLVVLLATDSGGKDSTTRRVFGRVNPQGCRVVSFGRPTELELRHDFLWRIHRQVPPRGLIGIFNRSHYEDVTVPRISDTITEDELERRYEHIRAFERLLHDSGTVIRKFHLSISRDEQAKRLQKRLDDPEKHWKFDPSDIDDRERWPDYQAAFEDAINATSTEDAPWYVVPANRKWFRDAVVTRVLVDTLEQMNPQYPDPVANLSDFKIT